MDKALQRQQIRERVKRYRNKQKALQSEGVTLQSVTEKGSVTSRYRPIMYALADPVKREKLRAICKALRRRGSDNLACSYFGCGVDPTSMLEVEELLEAFT